LDGQVDQFRRTAVGVGDFAKLRKYRTPAITTCPDEADSQQAGADDEVSGLGIEKCETCTCLAIWASRRVLACKFQS
jgi:hypothetical protein